MGVLVSKATRPIKNFGLEFRKDRLLESTKPQAAPRHPNTHIPKLNENEIDKIFNKSPSLVSNMNSLELKSFVVKDGILPEGTDYVKQSNRSLPQKLYGENPLPEPRVEHGFIVPDQIPKGTLKMQWVIDILAKYQRKEQSIEELAKEYSISVEIITNIVEHFSLFEFVKSREWLPSNYLEKADVKLVESHKFYEEEPIGGFNKLTNKKIIEEEKKDQLIKT